MKFQTERPGELAGLRRLRQRADRARSRIRAAPTCGGLLEVQHRPPELTRGRADRALHRAPRPAARRAGVGRLALPRGRAPVAPSDVVSHPEGNTPLLHREALDRWTGADRLLLKHEGHNPTGLVQGPRDDGRRDPGAAASARARSPAPPPATPRRRSRPTRRRRASRRWCSCRRARWRMGKLAQTLAYGARTLLVRGDFDACLRLVEEASAASSASTCSTRSTRSASRGRRRSCSSCCSSSAGSRPTGSCCRPATWATPPRSGRRCARRTRWGLISRLPRLAAVQAAGAAPFARSFAEDFAHALRGARGDGRHRHPDRRPRLVRARGARDPGDRRRGARGDRRGDPRGEGRGGRLRRGLRAGERRERRGRARAGAPQGSMAPEQHVGGGAHRPHPQGPGLLLQYHREMEPPPPGREPADRDRAPELGEQMRDE